MIARESFIIALNYTLDCLEIHWSFLGRIKALIVVTSIQIRAREPLMIENLGF